MIKNITFKRTDTIDDKEFDINFKEGTNIVVGPKGGGKSTLFNLMVGALNGYVAKSTLDALEDAANITPIKMTKTSGEVVTFRNLPKIPKKEFEGKVNKLPNVVWQNDEIKSKLDNTKDIIKSKGKFTDRILVDQDVIRKFVDKIKVLHNAFSKYMNLISKNITWDNIYLIKDQKEGFNPILELSYDPYNQSIINKDLTRQNEEVIDQLKTTIASIAKLSPSNFREGSPWAKNLEEESKKLIKPITHLEQELDSRANELKRINSYLKAFETAHKLTKRNIVAEQKEDGVAKTFRNEAINHFISIKQVIKEMSDSFNDLMSKDIILELSGEEEFGILNLKIDDEITFNQEVMVNILKTILYTPDSPSDIFSWIKAQVKNGGVKEFKEDLLLSRIKKEIIPHVHIMANNKKYESLSNGQKSIFGIKYKMNKAMGYDFLFLDQPEDNLDNMTVKQELVEHIKPFAGQTFIVTHNPNIGILTNTKNVIVANFDNEEPYLSGTIKIDKDNNSDIADYLEGGAKTLEQRFKIIFDKGENNDN